MSIDATRPFVVTVALTADGARSDLLALATVLHQRAVDVIEADFSRPAHGRRVFSATFHATSQQARTLHKSFENLIDVIDAALFEALDARVGSGTPEKVGMSDAIAEHV